MKKYRTLGDLLIDYRSFHSKSQSELASQLDVDVRSVIRWEKNETLVSSDKESVMSEMTFIPYQVIRNLNSTTQIPTFYDFDLRKYSLSALSSDLPDANWIKSRINYQTERVQSVSIARDIKKHSMFYGTSKKPFKKSKYRINSRSM